MEQNQQSYIAEESNAIEMARGGGRRRSAFRQSKIWFWNIFIQKSNAPVAPTDYAEEKSKLTRQIASRLDSGDRFGGNGEIAGKLWVVGRDVVDAQSDNNIV